MISSNYEYLIVLVACLFFPLILSLHPKSGLRGKYKLAIFSIFLVSLPWIAWDVYATYRGHWGFDYDYVLGPKIINLPLEEISFFWVVPFCCLFLWTVIRDFESFPKFFKDLFNRP